MRSLFNRSVPAGVPLSWRAALCALIVGGGLCAAHAETPRPAGCATAREIEAVGGEYGTGSPHAGGSAASVARASRASRIAAQTLRGRTYQTPHFAIHYTLTRGTNRVRLDETSVGDARLKALTDSLILTLASAPSSRRDSLLHARLDSLGAPHAAYALKAAQYFERAWAHYDSIGMRMPDSSASLFYVAPTYGRVAIDIADIGTASPSYWGEPYYGLAFPPVETQTDTQKATILLENDFLYRAAYNAGSDQVTGTAIRSIHNGATYRDYSVEWDLGLKVTASHEFYHIIQYEYTPGLASFHAWYELSATGMEERLAPEVNDYFQYLPFNVPHNHDITLLSRGTLANYGNAILHVFLSKAAGPGFDRAVWEALGDNKTLPGALVQAAGSVARWDSLLTAYAAAMSLAGTPGAASSPLAFSPDMPQWPMPHFDTVPAARVSQLRLDSLTYRLLRPPVTDTAIVHLIDIPAGRRVDSTTSGYVSVAATTPVALARAPGIARRTLAVANAGFTSPRQVLLSKRGTDPVLVQNPLKRREGSLFLLAPSGGVGSTDSLKVVSESGRLVATVPVDSSQAYWRWNLRGQGGRLVPAGVYLIRRAGQTPLPVLITP